MWNFLFYVIISKPEPKVDIKSGLGAFDDIHAQPLGNSHQLTHKAYIANAHIGDFLNSGIFYSPHMSRTCHFVFLSK